MKNPVNILVLTYWNYSDALIQTYTLPYLRIIRRQISKDSRILLQTQERNSLNALQKQKIREELAVQGIEWIELRYVPFGFVAMMKWSTMLLHLGYTIIRHKINFIHCWGTPSGMIGYILSIATGRSLIIDSYEPHAEAMVENTTWKRNSMAFRLLFWFEKKQTQRAKHLIGTTKGMFSYAQRTYRKTPKSFYVKPACVDLGLFGYDKLKNRQLLEELKLKDKIVCVYAGKFGGIYLDREIFDFLKVAVDHWGNSFRFLLLSGISRKEVDDYCNRTGLNPETVVHAFVPHADVPLYMGLADFALTPVRPVPTKQYCTPIKDGEYWALGLPVVITKNISDDSEIILENAIGAILTELNQDSYVKAMKVIEGILRLPREENFYRIRRIAEEYRTFRIAEEVYRSIY